MLPSFFIEASSQTIGDGSAASITVQTETSLLSPTNQADSGDEGWPEEKIKGTRRADTERPLQKSLASCVQPNKRAGVFHFNKEGCKAHGILAGALSSSSTCHVRLRSMDAIQLLRENH